jgi:uncharacterized integral membrane protein
MPEPDLSGEHTSIEGSRHASPDRRERTRLIALGVIGAIIVVFAVINLNSVKVHWLVTTDQAPLILVIVLAFLLGCVADRLLVIRAKRRGTDT